MESSTPFAKLFVKKYIDQKQPQHLFKTVAGLEILSCLFLSHSLAVQFYGAFRIRNAGMVASGIFQQFVYSRRHDPPPSLDPVSSSRRRARSTSGGCSCPFLARPG
jgi:hypothetical protein